MILKLAWRNIWRNKRRTWITIASIFFAVIMSTSMSGIKEGMYERMMDNSVGKNIGYVQIHGKGFWENRTFDNHIALTDSLRDYLLVNKNIDDVVPRIETFVMAIPDMTPRTAMLNGIDPEKENKLNSLRDRVKKGEYLDANDDAILIGEGLAKSLKMTVGDTLAISGTGYMEVTAEKNYRIKGIVKLGDPALNKKAIYLPLNEAQPLFMMEGLYTNLIPVIKDIRKTDAVAEQLKKDLPNREVMSWEEMVPQLKNLIESDRVEGYIIYGILYLIIAFGIFGTLLMMLVERQREFGVLVAVGYKRTKLAVMVWMETVIMSLLGALIGFAGAFPVLFWLHYNPIPLNIEGMEEMAEVYENIGMEPVLQASIAPWIVAQQATIVFVLACVLAIYPLVKLLWLNSIKAMRS